MFLKAIYHNFFRLLQLLSKCLTYQMLIYAKINRNKHLRAPAAPFTAILFWSEGKILFWSEGKIACHGGVGGLNKQASNKPGMN